MQLESLESEICVIGGVMLRPRMLDALAYLEPEHFIADPRHRTIWATIRELHLAGVHIDPMIVLTAHADRHGAFEGQHQMFADLTEQTPVNAHLEHYAATLHECLRRRQVRSIARQLAASGDEEEALRALQQTASTSSRDRWDNDPQRLATVAQTALDNPPIAPYGTGFAKWDRIAGLRAGELHVIAARPAHGKTALALNVACQTDVPVLVFSGEQDAQSVVLRMLASQSQVPLSSLRVDGVSAQHTGRLGGAVAWLQSSRIHVIDRPSPSLAEIERDTRIRVNRDGIRLVIVDYLQRMKSTSEHKWEAVTANVSGLKELARTHGICVLALAQAARTCDDREGEDRCPTLSDLQHASAIEQEADVVLGLYRLQAYEPETQDRSALLRVLKNRSGRTGNIRLAYDGATVTFTEPPPVASAPDLRGEPRRPIADYYGSDRPF